MAKIIKKTEEFDPLKCMYLSDFKKCTHRNNMDIRTAGTKHRRRCNKFKRCSPEFCPLIRGK